MSIQVQIKNIYVNETIYPICDKAKTFATMVKQKTLTREDIRHIKALGLSIEVISQGVVL